MHVDRVRQAKLASIAIVVFVMGWMFSQRLTYANSLPSTQTKNPLPETQANLALGLNHYTAHCAECHGDSGKADTEKGRSVGAIDLTDPIVQKSSDQELFNGISNGVPGTAMPAFSKTHSPTEIWQIILFLRKLPSLSPSERKKLEAAIPPEAAHHHHETGQNETMGTMDQDKSKDDMAGMDMKGTSQTSMSSLMVMMGNEMGIRLGSSKTNFISMSTMGSGTSWLPRSTPMYMYHREKNGWLLMFHFEAKTGVNSQGGSRGVTKAESENWFMPMAFHQLGPGTIEFRGMFSFEPFTFPRGGLPLLFQTGETFEGRPLIDKQHPHDLFMELSTTYTVPIGEHSSWFAYFGYPGEPALGPVA